MGKVGRPSLMALRRGQIVDAFIALVARNGLEAVTLDDISAAANVQRSSVRHFVGNRNQLIAAAIVELSERYARSIREAAGGVGGIDELIAMMFSPDWLADIDDTDRALRSLVEEAVRDEQLVDHVRRAVDALMAEIQAALRRDLPEVPAAQIRETAYSLVCLVEHNKFMQRLGYPTSLSKAAARSARALVGELTLV